LQKVEIIERYYCNRVERYVRAKDGSLMPLEVWASNPVAVPPPSLIVELAGTRK
jgi:hypothetical protein